MNARAALRLPDFRRLLAASAFVTLAARALFVVIGYQTYALTNDTMALGWLGLVQAIPALSLALLGGHVADRIDRRRIILLTQMMATLGVGVLAFLALDPATLRMPALYAAAFVIGIARGFAEPAVAALEAQVIPREFYVRASAWQGSAWVSCAIVGPALGGFAYDLIGAAGTYALIAALFAAAWLSVFRIARQPKPAAQPRDESVLRSISLGVRFVFTDQVLVGSMALDLFAVLFGGAIAMIPVFVTDILQVPEQRRGMMIGLLNAAPAIGALLVMLWSTRYPPTRHAGRILLICVFGFGLCMIAFAFSENPWLSMFVLGLGGAFDGVSMVIRKSIVRVLTPDHMRGRVSAVSMIFIGSSNEIGEFESGVAAKLIGTVQSVWLGGAITLLVVVITALTAPRLRRLRLDRGASGMEGDNANQSKT
jgi:MFS family permease